MSSDSTAFADIRPSCIELSKIAFIDRSLFDPKSQKLLEALKNVERKLDDFQDDILSQKFADYVFVPIGSLLKQPSLGDSQTEYVLLIVGHLLRLCWSLKGSFDKELATQLFPILTFLISQDRENKLLEKKSLHFKLVGSKVLLRFFESLSHQSYCREFFNTENKDVLPSLGHSVTILLDILVQTYYDVKIQLTTLEALNILYKEVISDGELLSFILPGNISTFTKLLTNRGLKVNYKVVIQTLKVLNVILILVYDDIDLNIKELPSNDLKAITATLDDDLKINSDIVKYTLNVEVLDKSRRHRDLSWLRATSSQVKRAFEAFIPKIIKRKNNSIDNELITLVTTLLNYCNISLSNCSGLFLTVLVDLKSNNIANISANAQTLREITETKIFNLNKSIQYEDVAEINSLSYSLKVTQHSDFSSLLIVSSITALLDSIEADSEQNVLKIYDNKIIEQSSNVIVTDTFNTESFDTISLLPTVSKDVEISLRKFLMSMGTLLNNSSSLDNTVDTIISGELKISSSRKIVSLWVASNLVAGLGAGQVTSVDDMLLDFGNTGVTFIPDSCYAILEYCNILYQEISFNTEGKGMTKYSEQAMCIILYSVTMVSNVMKEEFEPELIDSLYIVIDSLASSSQMVRSQAQVCATSIANNIYEGSVQKMILENIDYLVESISVKLNSGMTERVSTILMVICRVAGYKVIESFQDVIETMFKLLDYYHGYSELCYQFFQLFEVIILEMKKLYLSETDMFARLSEQHIVNSSFAPWGLANIDQVLSVLDKNVTDLDDKIEDGPDDPKDFQEYFDSNLREIDSDDEDNDEEGADSGEEETAFSAKKEETELWESPIPRSSYRVLLKILNYCDRLLTHPSKPLRVQILKIINLLIPMLSTQHNSLLPQVAQIWDTVVECCMSSDFSIVKPACECLETIIIYSKDFISKRFLSLWDKLKSDSVILQRIHTASGKQDRVSTELLLHQKFPPITKDALVALSSMLLAGVETTELFLSEVTLEEMIYCCIQVLRTEAVSSKSILIGDTVWGIVHCHL